MVEIKRELLKRYPNLDIKIATVFYKEKALLLPEFKVKRLMTGLSFSGIYIFKGKIC